MNPVSSSRKIVSSQALKEEMKKAEVELRKSRATVRKMKEEYNRVLFLKQKLKQLESDIQFEKKQTKKASNYVNQTRIKFEAAVAREYVQEMDAQNKKILKPKKGSFSEPILQKIAQLPLDCVNIIKEFLPVSVWNRLMEISVKKLLQNSPKSPGTSKEMKFALFQYMCRQPDFLAVLDKKRAIEMVEHNSAYRFSYYSSDVELKNKIRMAINMAINKKPEFAYKILKAFVILGRPHVKRRVNSYMSIGQALNYSHLPAEYQDN